MQTIRYRRDLHMLFEDPSRLVCAEVGVAEGFFAADMLSWGIEKLYMVDMWESHPEMRGDAANLQGWHDKNYNDAMKRVEKYAGRFEALRGPSVRMAQLIAEPLDLVNIDADHSYEGVKADIEAYWPKIRRGGVISFHDFEAAQYGVKRAVMEFAQANNLTVNLLPEDKKEDAGAWIRKP